MALAVSFGAVCVQAYPGGGSRLPVVDKYVSGAVAITSHQVIGLRLEGHAERKHLQEISLYAHETTANELN
jgi:hypothetical protein